MRYSYDGANRLVEVELYTGGSYTTLSTAVYNGLGERLSLTTYALGVPLTTTYTTAEGQLLVTAVGTQTTLSLYGQTQIAEYGSDWSYPLRDSSSSVRQMTNQAGAVTLARSYKPFGAILAESGPYETAFGFLGAQLDQVSGLLFVGGRYYDPATGRFLTPDHSRMNPYAPVQGPGIWLLLPLVGIVVAWKGRKKGAGRMVVLVCVVGVGMTLVSCGGQPSSTPQPVPPILPTSTIAPLGDVPTHTPEPDVSDLVDPLKLIATTVKIFLPPPSFECPPDDADITLELLKPLLPGGLGTLIKYQDTVAALTHDHFAHGGINPQESEKIILTRSVSAITSDFEYKSIDQGDTSLIVLPQQTEQRLRTELVAELAELGDPGQVTQGKWLQQVYIPGDNFHEGQLSVLVTRLNDINPDNGHLLLEDKENLTGGGDSGGGVFYKGKLMGNLHGTFPRPDALDPDHEIIKVNAAPPIPLSILQ